MKLFVTVGTQLAFDRLITAVDEWAGRHREAQVFAQVGPTALRPAHLEWAPFIDAGECRRRVEESTAVIAHAGMGSIITALELGKPIVVMPRRAVYNEHRNDHQIATARSLLAQGHVSVAFNEQELAYALDHIESLTTGGKLATHASPRLLAVIRDFISSGVPKSEAHQVEERIEDAHREAKVSPTRKAVVAANSLMLKIIAENPVEAPFAKQLVGFGEPLAELGYEDCGLGISSAVSVERPRLATRRRTIYRSVPTGRRLPEGLRNLRALILLEGAVRRSAFSQSIGRSFLELPVDSTRSLLDLWQHQLKTLTGSMELDRLPCRIVVGHSARPPRLRPDDLAADLLIERDPKPFRGTGGVLRDLADEYDEDDLLLVASAAQVLTRPLTDMALDAAAYGGDVTILGSHANVPTSMMLLKCAALKQLPSTGFVDFKEQGLRLLQSDYHVVVHRDPEPSGLSIRTPAEYLEALRVAHQLENGANASGGPFTERWRSAFAVVEKGATIASDVRLHDSVVLAGASVEAGSSIARSIVCGGTRVPAGTREIGQILSRGGAVPLDAR